MQPRIGRFVGVVVSAVALLVAVVAVRADTFRLERKRLSLDDYDPPKPWPDNGSSFDLVCPLLSVGGPQKFHLRPDVIPPAFRQVIQRELKQYNSRSPLRCVVKLAGGQYGFVLDTSEGRPDEYMRLHFDLNHNGDLTDDKAIEGERPKSQPRGSLRRGDWSCVFPRIDLVLDVDGRKVDYSFFLSAHSHQFAWASAMGPAESVEPPSVDRSEKTDETESDVTSGWAALPSIGWGGGGVVEAELQTAVYYEGGIELGGKARRVVLLDANSNGRFDDRIAVAQEVMQSRAGDLVLVDLVPPKEGSDYYDLLGGTIGHDLLAGQVADLTSMDGRLYTLTVSHDGSQIALSPTSVETGYFIPPADGFRAVLYSAERILAVRGDKSDRIELPAGDWKLWSYTIDATERRRNTRKTQHRSPLTALSNAITETAVTLFVRLTYGHIYIPPYSGGRVGRAAVVAMYGPPPNVTRLDARGPDDKVFQVSAGHPCEFPFGPPYRPVIETEVGCQVDGLPVVQFTSRLIGAGGEWCSGLVVDGFLPDAPEYSIHTTSGEAIRFGQLEWGMFMACWENWPVPAGEIGQYNLRIQWSGTGPFELEETTVHGTIQLMPEDHERLRLEAAEIHAEIESGQRVSVPFGFKIGDWRFLIPSSSSGHPVPAGVQAQAQ